MLRNGRTLLIMASLLANGLGATELRVVRFLVQPDFSPPPCLSLASWYSETYFHNSTDSIQTVQFLGVSNGSPGPNPRPLAIPPHQTVKIDGYEPFLGWEPVPGTLLWVNRLNVPPGVIVANRVASGVYDVSGDTSGITCIPLLTNYAGLPLPIFGALIPSGTTQFFLGVDVGSDSNGTRTTNSRLNVGVYNGGATPATALVNVYCRPRGANPILPNSLVSAVQIQVPADSVVQKSVLSSTLTAACPLAVGLWYATVTVDQPSFAYAIGLANGRLPTFPGTAALTYTGN